ncbi:hypothetical protein B0H13DRAFT_1881919 [Mycena leptocephala]|nr:hypothetical protein B0H13DRAFT_1881919 [Mycena leptocephala]
MDWLPARMEGLTAGCATGNGCRGRCNPRVCTVRASTVAEIEGSQCVRRRRRRRRQGGTLAACVADTVGVGVSWGDGPECMYWAARRDWSEDAHGARGPDAGVGVGHQGAPTQLLRMHLVLRVVRSGCTAGVSFEQWDSIQTVASDNRDGARREVRGLWIMKGGVNVDVEEAERKKGSGRETHQNRAIPINPDPSQKGESSGPAIDASMFWAECLDSSGTSAVVMVQITNLNVEGQRERDRGQDQAGVQRSASTRSGKDVQRVRCKRREYVGVSRGVPPSLREKILSQGLALSSGGQGSGAVEGVVQRAVK